MFFTTPSFLFFFARLVLKALWPSVGKGGGGEGGEGGRDYSLSLTPLLQPGGFTNKRRFSYVEINSEHSDGYGI